MPSEKQKGYRNEWDRKNMVVLGCKVRKEVAENFRAACSARGTNVNAVFLKTISEFLADGAHGEASTGDILEYVPENESE